MSHGSQKYSVIPDRDTGVHAVYDQVIRRAFHCGTLRAGGLQAVCGQAVLPANRLTAAKLCQGCTAALAPTDKPRPAPGSPLLREMAALYPGGDR